MCYITTCFSNWKVHSPSSVQEEYRRGIRYIFLEYPVSSKIQKNPVL